MGSHQSLVDLQVGRTATQTLHVDTPFLGVKVKRLQGSCLTCELHGVDVLVSSVVSCSRISFRVFVRHGRTQGIEDSAGGDIFGGDEDDGLALSLDFFSLVKVHE